VGKYGKDGVAICSRYGLLKAALAALPDRAMLGLVRYGFDHVGWNILRFITTKRRSLHMSARSGLLSGNRNGPEGTGTLTGTTNFIESH